MSIETVNEDPHPAPVVAVAELVWTGAVEDVFAVVKQPAHVRYLSEQCRLVGVAIDVRNATAGTAGDDDTSAAATAGDGALLRLRLEEIYVGLCQSLLTLQQPDASASDSSACAFSSELLHAVSRGEEAPPAMSHTASSTTLQLTATQTLRLRVFHDLWTRGYFVSFGSKFSADFLIYDDAPSRAHATALVIVKAHDAPFDAVDIVSHCRVAKMVRKQVFFASQQPRDSVITYIAINHALLAARQER